MNSHLNNGRMVSPYLSKEIRKSSFHKLIILSYQVVTKTCCFFSVRCWRTNYTLLTQRCSNRETLSLCAFDNLFMVSIAKCSPGYHNAITNINAFYINSDIKIKIIISYIIHIITEGQTAAWRFIYTRIKVISLAAHLVSKQAIKVYFKVAVVCVRALNRSTSLVCSRRLLKCQYKLNSTREM